MLLAGASLLWGAKFHNANQSVNESSREVAVRVTAGGSKPVVIEGPAKSAFEEIELPSEEQVVRSLVCADAYYVVALFPADADYRTEPRRAVYNTASPCVKGEPVEATLLLSLVTAPAGSYYMVVADQGVEGTWYNPR